jgi:hypothetical protein
VVGQHVDVVQQAELSTDQVAPSTLQRDHVCETQDNGLWRRKQLARLQVECTTDVHIRLGSAYQDQLTLLPARVLLKPGRLGFGGNSYLRRSRKMKAPLSMAITG